MIVYGQDGKGKGKLGSSVYLINHGVQVKREYTGSVSNPSTEAQVNQRTRFKLASQVSAVLEPVIVIPRQGIRSPRNLFVKRNMNYFYGSGQEATVTFENLQLTAGCVGLPGISVDRETPSTLSLGLRGLVQKVISHVVYAIYLKTDENLLQYMDSVVVPISEDNPTGFVEVDDIEGELIIYAYGFKGRNAKAIAKYNNYQIDTAMDVARLVANRTLEGKDYMFTATRGTSIADGASGNIQPSDGKVLLYLRATSNGQIVVTQGAEEPITISQAVFDLQKDTSVTLRATHPENHQFWGWYNNGEQQPFSTAESITFSLTEMRDIVAQFSNVGGLE